MAADISGEPFPLEELIGKGPSEAREAFLERSAAFEAGDLVRAMREKRGFSQKVLAQKIATSQSHLSEIERGNGLQGPTFSMLRKIEIAHQGVRVNATTLTAAPSAPVVLRQHIPVHGVQAVFGMR